MSIVELEIIEQKIIARMIRTARLFDKMIGDEVAQKKLTKPQVDILFILKYAPVDSLTTTELAEELFVSKANITGIVTRLLNAGYMTKVVDEKDTRSKKISLTEAGNALISGISPRYLQMAKDALSSLTTEELEKLHEQLNHVETYILSKKNER